MTYISYEELSPPRFHFHDQLCYFFKFQPPTVLHHYFTQLFNSFFTSVHLFLAISQCYMNTKEISHSVIRLLHDVQRAKLFPFAKIRDRERYKSFRIVEAAIYVNHRFHLHFLSLFPSLRPTMKLEKTYQEQKNSRSKPSEFLISTSLLSSENFSTFTINLLLLQIF